MSRPRGSKNRPKVASQQAIEALHPRRPGRPTARQVERMGTEPGNEPEKAVGLPRISPEQAESKPRRGRPKGSHNRQKGATQQASSNGPRPWTLDDLAPPESSLSKEPATDTFCPVAKDRVHHPIKILTDTTYWCTYCSRKLPRWSPTQCDTPLVWKIQIKPNTPVKDVVDTNI